MPPRSAPSLLLASVLLLLPGCGRSRAPAGGAGDVPTPRPAEPGRVAYRPPVDGRLTRPQVEACVGVLEKVKLDEGRRPAGSALAPGDPLSLESLDVVVARERGLNVSEYLWVRERVLEAEAAALSERLMAGHLTMLERTLAELRTRRAAAPDEGSKMLLGEQIANFEAEANRTRREAREKEPDAVRANMKVIEPYRARLEAAGDVLDRPVLRGAAPARSPDAVPGK